jgi:ferric-chelate reductase
MSSRKQSKGQGTLTECQLPSCASVSLLMRANRIRAAARSRLRPAKSTNIFVKILNVKVAIFRMLSYPQFTPARTVSWLQVPPAGTIFLLLAYLGFVLALEFINNDVPGAQHYTALGVRAAWLAIAQMPLLILLAGKNNLIGFVTGVSYERLNVLHRWVARGLLLLITLHFGYQSYGWNQYGLMQLEWKTDLCSQTGIAAYAILLWMNLSTLAPIRNFSYEFFVVQHSISFFSFIIAVMLHMPSTALYSRVYIYIPVGLYLVDRLIRTSRFAYNNVRPGRATLTAMSGEVTKICVYTQKIKNWTPGAHVFLSIPNFGPGQSHPATIASIPSSHDNNLIFILKARKGFTKRIMKFANSSAISLSTAPKQEAAETQETYTALIDGPYGGSHPDFATFDTVLLISGSTGVTFTLPLLLDIAHRVASQKLPIRRLEFIWIVKSTRWTSWISEELPAAFHKLQAAGIEVAIRIFVTCDDAFTEPLERAGSCGCGCDKSLGRCRCTNMEDLENPHIAIPVQSTPANVTQDVEAPHLNQTTPKAASLSSPPKPTPAAHPHLPSLATFTPGRPSFYPLLSDLAHQIEGEMGIAVCGPGELSSAVKNTVAKITAERTFKKGAVAQGIFLHAENFGC